MVSSMISSQAVNIINRASPVQASMVAPFTGLKSIVGFPITWKANNAITTINFVHDNNNGWVPCLEFELEFGTGFGIGDLIPVEEAKTACPNACISFIA
ncbi:hypothetical protein Lal_00017203 [Lupinus albus]|nr:hypothetical protein Lal_00017203 [Lupinus albus]